MTDGKSITQTAWGDGKKQGREGNQYKESGSTRLKFGKVSLTHP